MNSKGSILSQLTDLPASRPVDLPARTIQHVLVVDDSRLQRRILGALLKKWGFAVTEADSGDRALEICREAPPIWF